MLEAGDAGGGFAFRHDIIHGDAHRAAAGGGCALGDGAALLGKNAAQLPVHGAGIGASFRLLVLEFIELAEDIHRNPHMVFIEALDAGGVVQEHIRIEDVVLAGGKELARLLLLFLFCARACFNLSEEAGLGLVLEVLRDVLVRIELVHGLRLGKKETRCGVKERREMTEGRRKEFPEPEIGN